MSCVDEVIDRSDDEHRSVGQGRPVHGLNDWMVESGEEAHDEGQEEESNGGDVDGYTEFTEVELALEERLAANASKEDANDGDEI